MELYDFNRHAQAGREELVWRYGAFLVARPQEEYYLVLYNMGTFFAEVQYRKESNSIEWVRGFKSMSCLQPYLDLVDLSEIT